MKEVTAGHGDRGAAGLIAASCGPAPLGETATTIGPPPTTTTSTSTSTTTTTTLPEVDWTAYLEEAMDLIEGRSVWVDQPWSALRERGRDALGPDPQGSGDLQRGFDAFAAFARGLPLLYEPDEPMYWSQADELFASVEVVDGVAVLDLPGATPASETWGDYVDEVEGLIASTVAQHAPCGWVLISGR